MKAESLYNICDFEHALVLFTRGQYLSQDSSLVQNGILKCKKTISNKICNENIFSFDGSTKFFNHLRKEGDGAVEAFINGENNSFKAVSSLAAIKQKSKKGKERTESGKKKQVVKIDRMKADNMFLKNLEKTIKPLSGMTKDPVR